MQNLFLNLLAMSTWKASGTHRTLKKEQHLHKADYTSLPTALRAGQAGQNDCKEKFAKILQDESMNSKTSACDAGCDALDTTPSTETPSIESNALIDLEFTSIPSEEPTILAGGQGDKRARGKATKVQQEGKAERAKQFTFGLSAPHTSQQAGKPPEPFASLKGKLREPEAEGAGRQVGDPECNEGEQVLLMPYLQPLMAIPEVSPVLSLTGVSKNADDNRSITKHQPFTAFEGKLREPKAEGPDSRDSAQFIPLAGRNVGERSEAVHEAEGCEERSNHAERSEQLWQAPRGSPREISNKLCVYLQTPYPISRGEEHGIDTVARNEAISNLSAREGDVDGDRAHRPYTVAPSGLREPIQLTRNHEQTNLSDVLPTDVIAQIGDEIQVNLKMGLRPVDLEGRQELRVQLKPEHLGSITLKVSMVEGVLSVDISTENTAVKSIIESHLHDLRQNLIQRGIEVGRFNISAEPTPYPLQGRGESDNMSQFGSQGGMFSSYSSDSRRNARQSPSWEFPSREGLGVGRVGSQQSLLLYPEDETLEQKNWFLKQTMVDIWI